MTYGFAARMNKYGFHFSELGGLRKSSNKLWSCFVYSTCFGLSSVIQNTLCSVWYCLQWVFLHTELVVFPMSLKHFWSFLCTKPGNTINCRLKTRPSVAHYTMRQSSFQIMMSKFCLHKHILVCTVSRDEDSLKTDNIISAL